MTRSAGMGKRNMKVLVLDDSHLPRKRLSDALHKSTDVEVLDGGRDFLNSIRMVRELKPDTVILDMRVKKRLGINILRNIRKTMPAIVVVMLTNKLLSDRFGQETNDEADFLFDKFTEMDKLLNILTHPRGHALAQ